MKKDACFCKGLMAILYGCPLLCLGVFGTPNTCAAFDFFGKKTSSEGVPQNQVQPNESAPKRSAVATHSFAPVVRQVVGSVVTVFTTKKIRVTSNSQHPLMNDPVLRHFFGLPQMGDNEDDSMQGRSRGWRRQQPQQREPFREQRGLGSGVIVSKDGYIITNNHVIDVADEIKVRMNGRPKDYMAKLVGKDPSTDIAIIKVEEGALPTLKMGDSDKLEVGDMVLAVGNPFGIGQTVTMGIVSAVGRNLPEGISEGAASLANFIQTDASINQGNSGGALVDAEGRLIGINTMIFSNMGGGNIGIGFAVPINLVRNVMEQIIKTGKVSRGFLGVGIQDITEELAKEFKLPSPGGVLVTQVSENSAASEAGLQKEDVILAINDKKIESSRQMRSMVMLSTPGSTCKIKLFRGGKEKTVEVKLKEYKEPSEDDAGNSSKSGDGSGLFEGVELGDLDATTRSQLQIPSNVSGVIIMGINPESPVARSGLLRGDVILEINRTEVGSAKEALAMAQKSKSSRYLLRVLRNGHSLFVVVGGK